MNITHNLQILGSLQVGQKLIVEGDRLSIDDRVWFVYIQRRLTGDRWQEAEEPIKQLFAKGEPVAPKAIIGLKNLIKTYEGNEEATKAITSWMKSYRSYAEVALPPLPKEQEDAKRNE